MDKRKKLYFGVGIIIILLLCVFIGRRMKQNGGSITVPKTVSFAQELKKKQGTRVWFYTDYGEGKGKNATVDYIYVISNGKMTQYQLFDDNITLGKLSKMSNSELISLGKKQDRKYFDESINEVKAF